MSDKVKILIADKDSHSLQYMKMQLEMADYFVLAPVTSGEEAIAAAKREKPDVLLINICLDGDKNGLDTSREILACLETNIILMTEYQNMDLLTKTDDIKLAYYFVKPFDIGKVKQIIDSLAVEC